MECYFALEIDSFQSNHNRFYFPVYQSRISSLRLMFKHDHNPRILIFSQRNASKRLPFRCAHFEFEDVISQIDSAELLAPRFDLSTRRHAVTKKIAYHLPLALNPGIPTRHFGREYELFFAVCGDPSDLLRIHNLGNWRQRCRKAVCLIDELWIRPKELGAGTAWHEHGDDE